MSSENEASSARSSWPLARTLSTFRDRLGLFATYAASQPLQDAIPAPEFSPVLLQVAHDLRRFPALEKAARLSPDVRTGIMFAYKAFGSSRRENRDEPMVWHSMEIANEVAEQFGPKAAAPIIKALLHDVKEDCDVKDATIRALFNKRPLDPHTTGPRFNMAIVYGVDRLSHHYEAPPGTSWQEKTAAKLLDKLQRAPKLLADELAIRMIDNLHEVNANAKDFEDGLLRIDGTKVVRVRRGNTANISEFSTKLSNRATLNTTYATLLRAKGKIQIGSVLVDCEKVANDLSAKFSAAHRAQHAYLTGQEPIPVPKVFSHNDNGPLSATDHQVLSPKRSTDSMFWSRMSTVAAKLKRG